MKTVNFKVFRAAFILAFGECNPQGHDFFYGVQGVVAEVTHENEQKYRELAKGWGLPPRPRVVRNITFRDIKYAQFNYDARRFCRLGPMRGDNTIPRTSSVDW